MVFEGLTEKESTNEMGVRIQKLFRDALSMVAFLPGAYMTDKWTWSVCSGRVSYSNYCPKLGWYMWLYLRETKEAILILKFITHGFCELKLCAVNTVKLSTKFRPPSEI